MAAGSRPVSYGLLKSLGLTIKATKRQARADLLYGLGGREWTSEQTAVQSLDRWIGIAMGRLKKVEILGDRSIKEAIEVGQLRETAGALLGSPTLREAKKLLTRVCIEMLERLRV